MGNVYVVVAGAAFFACFSTLSGYPAWIPGPFWFWLLIALFCAYKLTTLIQKEVEICPQCGAAGTFQPTGEEEIDNTQHITRKRVDREWTRDIKGNKIAYTDKVSYEPEVVVTKKAKWVCSKCTHFEYL
jgi:hypothetical protein